MNALFVLLISHQTAVLFSLFKPAISNQPAVLFSQSKPAPAISHQPNERAGNLHPYFQSNHRQRLIDKSKYPTACPAQNIQGKILDTCAWSISAALEWKYRGDDDTRTRRGGRTERN
jgi:hypothetical protein